MPLIGGRLIIRSVMNERKRSGDKMSQSLRQGIDALLIPKRAAFDAIGVGNTKGYELIGAGVLVARKLGSRTMIEAESLQRFVSSLPRVTTRDAA